MRLIAVLLSVLLWGAFGAGAETGLDRVRVVYLFPMANGFDQYLANRITNLGVLAVVTDPPKADAIISDRLGPAFERQLEELYGERTPPPAPEKPEGAPEAEATPTEGPPAKAEPALRFSSFARARGTLFVVDPRTRMVLWSTYERPESLSPEQLDRAAERVATRLNRDLRRK